MHILVRKGDGKFYMSAAFAGYSSYESKIMDDARLIIFNEEKTKLIEQPVFDKSKEPYIVPLVLFYKNDVSDWEFDIWKNGEMTCFEANELEEAVKSGMMSKELLEKCLEIDSRVEYKEWNEIKSDEDIADLMHLFGGFHDASVGEEIEKISDDSVSVMFFGMRSSSLEIIFTGDVSYDISFMKNENIDHTWLDSSLLYENGQYCLVNDYYKKIADIEKDAVWFKAKAMKYRVIPD